MTGMTQRLFIDGPLKGRWMDWNDVHTVRTVRGTYYSLLWAMVPGWRVPLRFYTSTMHPGSAFPDGMELPGHVAGHRFECRPVGSGPRHAEQADVDT